MITNVKVRRVRNTLSYMPEWMVGLCENDSPIISIVYNPEYAPKFPSEQPVLVLVDDGLGMGTEHVIQAAKFAREHRGKNINVHCYMGQQRSKWIAEHLQMRMPEYVILKHRPDGLLLDHTTHHNKR